jgi:hypothetical protein
MNASHLRNLVLPVGAKPVKYDRAARNPLAIAFLIATSHLVAEGYPENLAAPRHHQHGNQDSEAYPEAGEALESYCGEIPRLPERRVRTPQMLEKYGGDDEMRTRDLCRDRAA